jgi:hypothetical protein
MDTQRGPNFPRRLDENGIYHSICSKCFQTVAISSNEVALIEAEERHVCKRPLWSGMKNPLERASTTGRWSMRVSW